MAAAKLLRGVTRALTLAITDRAGEPVSFVGATVKVILRADGSAWRYEPSLTINGNEVSFGWNADNQPYSGGYTIILIADYTSGNVNRVVWHGDTSIVLVDYSYQEGGDTDDVDAGGVFSLAGSWTVNGASAYEIWLGAGHTGDEDAFLAWLRQPAVDAASAAEAQMAVIQGRADEDHARAGNDHTTAGQDHTRAGNDHTTATDDHRIAAADHSTATDDHTLAASDHATAEADHTQAASDHTQASSDHTTAEADHGIAASDHTAAAADHTQAGNDHSRAESDHTTAASDHSQAGTDHTRAEGDHATAGQDHTQAGSDHTTAASDHTTAAADHTQAESDHSRAESDHTAIVPNLRVIAEAIAELSARLTAIENGRDTLGEAKAITISAREVPRVCGFPLILYAAGVPAAATVPVEWARETMGEWTGAPNFIGQIYINTAATGSAQVVYHAKGVGAVSDWK